MEERRRHDWVMIPAGYLIVAVLWIVLSDVFLADWIPGGQTAKGLLFVFATAVGLAWILRRLYGRIGWQSESAEREADRYDTLFHGAPVAIIERDPEGRLTRHNRAASAWFEGLVQGQSGRLVPRAGTDSIELNSSTTNIVMLPGREERRFYQRVSVPVKKTGGTVELYVDITEQHESDLRAQLLVEALDRITEVVVLGDENGITQYANKALETVTGIAPRDRIGKPVQLILEPESFGIDREELESALDEKGVWSGEGYGSPPDGRRIPGHITVYRFVVGPRKAHLLVTRDLSAERAHRQTLEHVRQVDALTQLSRRRTFVACVEAAVRNEERGCLAWLDLDGLNAINRSFGTRCGDAALRFIAGHLESNFGAPACIGRVGGDEFALFAFEPPEEVLRRIESFNAVPFTFEGETLSISVTCGVAEYPTHASSVDALIASAEAAARQARFLGGGQHAIFDDSMRIDETDSLRLVPKLRSAIDNDDISIALQPQIDLRDGSVVGFEALARWTDAQLGVVSPGRFIPVAEKAGLIASLTRAVARQSLRAIRNVSDHAGRPLRIAVNLSAISLSDSTFPSWLAHQLEETGVAPSQVEIEITESVLIRNPEEADRRLDEFRELGIAVAIDDFGTGYSSLAYLSRFALDRLKLDMTFVRGLPDDESSRAICKTIIAMANNLGLQTVAEGVEKCEQRSFLEAEGCTLMQGFLEGRPMPLEEARNWIASRIEAA